MQALKNGLINFSTKNFVLGETVVAGVVHEHDSGGWLNPTPLFSLCPGWSIFIARCFALFQPD